VHKKAVLENVNQLEAADMTAETAKSIGKRLKNHHRRASEKAPIKLMDLIQEANIRKREQ